MRFFSVAHVCPSTDDSVNTVMKIGFLLNHDQSHQVAHCLPIALAMQRQYPQAEIVVATSSDALTAEVRRLAEREGSALQIAQLELKGMWRRALARGLESLVPLKKLGLYGANLEFFRQLDLLVVSEKTSLMLKSRYGLTDLPIVHTRHGAGDRAIGFDKASARFDHVLVSGPKIRDRLEREAGVSPSRMSMTGYPKFDLAPPEWTPPFADRSLPTVVYNPHPSPHLSSWYRHGRDVLDYFIDNPRYNLIFAPHVMLFHRRFVVTIDRMRVSRPGRIAQRYLDAPNIHIDLGSHRSTDMTYTMAGDIYLGDVSSQIYEFLRTPRPCLFLNSHGADWHDDVNYTHWRAGSVIDIPDRLERDRLDEALEQAVATHDRYLPVQRELFDYSFSLTDIPSAERAARAIMSFAGQGAGAAPLPDQPFYAPDDRVAAA